MLSLCTPPAPADGDSMDTLISKSGICADVLATIADLMQDIKGLLENSADKLSKEFQDLASSSQAQSQKVKTIIDRSRTLRTESEEITLNEFTEVFQQTLSRSVDQIVLVSHTAMELVFKLTEAKDNLTILNRSIGKIQQINRQASILAINAMIEAKRAGDAGGCFAVVADEMKKMSREINELTDEMRGGVGSINHHIISSYNSLQDVATADLSEQIVAREKLTTLLQALMTQSDDFREILADAADTSEKISNNINALTMDMQFQDRSCQFLDNSINMMAPVIDILQKIASLQNDTPMMSQPAEDFAKAIVSKIFLQEITTRFQKKRGMEAEVIPLSAGKTPAPSDDIELF